MHGEGTSTQHQTDQPCWPAREPGHQPDSRSAVGGADSGTLLQSRTTREEGGDGKSGNDGGNHQGFPLWEMRMRRTERSSSAGLGTVGSPTEIVRPA